MKSDAFSAEIDAIEEVSEKYGIKNIIFYKWDKIEYKDLINKLEKFWILLYNYSNKEELKDRVLDINKEYEVIFVNTALEFLISTVNFLRESLNQPLTEHAELFRDKSLQRSLLQEYNDNLGIKFLKWIPEDFDIQDIEEKIWYPFIIKPIDGVESLGVDKILNRSHFIDYLANYQSFHDIFKARWVDNKELIIEEFIDGKLYSVDYYVNNDWEVFMSKPIEVVLGVDIGINDYFVFTRTLTEDTEKDFKWKRLKNFVKSSVKACAIKNTFVHHEFKINSQWDFKTIEFNGRLWWGRLESLERAYDLNMYEYIVNPELKPWKLKQNSIDINIYAPVRGILEWYNNNILAKFLKRTSVFKIDLNESFLWKEVWLTKDGFIKLGCIKLKNTDFNELSRDYKYIKRYYKDILKVKEPRQRKRDRIIKHVKKIFKK